MLSKSTEIKSPLFIKNLVYLILRSPFPFIKFLKKFLPSLNKFSKNNPVLRLLGLLLFIWHLSVVIILRKHLFLKIPDPLQWSFPSSTSEQFLSFRRFLHIYRVNSNVQHLTTQYVEECFFAINVQATFWVPLFSLFSLMLINSVNLIPITQLTLTPPPPPRFMLSARV